MPALYCGFHKSVLATGIQGYVHANMWKPLVRCWKIIKQYLCNCNIHGLRYLGDSQFSYFERLFWLVACGLCWWGCATMIASVIRDSLENPVAITPETTFLDWSTPFPSVAFCFTTNAYIKKNYFKMKPGNFPNYSSPAVAKATAEELLEVFEQLKVPCSTILRSCRWNMVEFDCCQEFFTMPKSGLGHCMGFNSMHTPERGVHYLLNVTTYTNGDLVIDMPAGKEMKTTLLTLEVYLLSNAQLPSVTTDEDQKVRVRSGYTTYIPFTLESTANQDGVQNVDIVRRNCRFHNELLNGSYYDTYTFDTCILQVMIEQMIRFCGCVHFFYHAPPGIRTCSMSELECILQHKTAIVSPDIVNVKCLANCDQLDIDVSPMDPFASDNKEITRLHFSSLMFPRLRYRRYVVHDLLDIVISVGGAVGLFMGASILSIFEIPYWLFIRRDKIA